MGNLGVCERVCVCERELFNGKVAQLHVIS